jgi:hypothetical protein
MITEYMYWAYFSKPQIIKKLAATTTPLRGEQRTNPDKRFFGIIVSCGFRCNVATSWFLDEPVNGTADAYLFNHLSM